MATLVSGGSLFLTRPSLFDYVADRQSLEERAGEVLGLAASGELPSATAILADDIDGIGFRDRYAVRAVFFRFVMAEERREKAAGVFAARSTAVPTKRPCGCWSGSWRTAATWASTSTRRRTPTIGSA